MKVDIDFNIKEIKIGRLLKIKRESLKLTQGQVAKKLKVSLASIEHKEAGIRGISLEFLKKWGEILGLEIIFNIKSKNGK